MKVTCLIKLEEIGLINEVVLYYQIQSAEWDKISISHFDINSFLDIDNKNYIFYHPHFDKYVLNEINKMNPETFNAFVKMLISDNTTIMDKKGNVTYDYLDKMKEMEI